MTKQRIDKVKFNSIQVEEFISALAKTEYSYKGDFIPNRVDILLILEFLI